MKTKNIKVVYTNRYSKNSNTTVPKIQMEGQWLEQLGFTIGTPLIVEYEKNSIHIRTLTEEELAEKEQQESHIGLIICTIPCCITLSITVGIPSFLLLPFGLGISTRFTG